MLHDVIKPLIAIVIILFVTLIASSLILGKFSSYRLIGAQGDIETPPFIGIYWDNNGTNPVQNITWGSLQPNFTVNKTFYIRNQGTKEINLTLRAENWNPSNLSSYMSLTWNYDGTLIQPKEKIQVTLSLSTSPDPDFVDFIIANDLSTFTFNIVINAYD